MKILKAVIFYPMLLLRRVVLKYGHVLAGSLLLSIIVFGTVKYVGAELLSWWKLALYGFCASVFLGVTVLYDRILEWLNPTGEPLDFDE
ncbi:MAG: hypothetical protein OXN26_15710 [Gammaproteobacteria bacterium]|nr:hypothetical protein [Gammaproteobacteria bacterium]